MSKIGSINRTIINNKNVININSDITDISAILFGNDASFSKIDISENLIANGDISWNGYIYGDGSQITNITAYPTTGNKGEMLTTTGTEVIWTNDASFSSLYVTNNLEINGSEDLSGILHMERAEKGINFYANDIIIDLSVEAEWTDVHGQTLNNIDTAARALSDSQGGGPHLEYKNINDTEGTFKFNRIDPLPGQPFTRTSVIINHDIKTLLAGEVWDGLIPGYNESTSAPQWYKDEHPHYDIRLPNALAWTCGNRFSHAVQTLIGDFSADQAGTYSIVFGIGEFKKDYPPQFNSAYKDRLTSQFTGGELNVTYKETNGDEQILFSLRDIYTNSYTQDPEFLNSQDDIKFLQIKKQFTVGSGGGQLKLSEIGAVGLIYGLIKHRTSNSITPTHSYIFDTANIRKNEENITLHSNSHGVGNRGECTIFEYDFNPNPPTIVRQDTKNLVSFNYLDGITVKADETGQYRGGLFMPSFETGQDFTIEVVFKPMVFSEWEAATIFRFAESNGTNCMWMRYRHNQYLKFIVTDESNIECFNYEIPSTNFSADFTHIVLTIKTTNLETPEIESYINGSSSLQGGVAAPGGNPPLLARKVQDHRIGGTRSETKIRYIKYYDRPLSNVEAVNLYTIYTDNLLHSRYYEEKKEDVWEFHGWGKWHDTSVEWRERVWAGDKNPMQGEDNLALDIEDSISQAKKEVHRLGATAFSIKETHGNSLNELTIYFEKPDNDYFEKSDIRGTGSIRSYILGIHTDKYIPDKPVSPTYSYIFNENDGSSYSDGVFTLGSKSKLAENTISRDGTKEVAAGESPPDIEWNSRDGITIPDFTSLSLPSFVTGGSFSIEIVFKPGSSSTSPNRLFYFGSSSGNRTGIIVSLELDGSISFTVDTVDNTHEPGGEDDTTYSNNINVKTINSNISNALLRFDSQTKSYIHVVFTVEISHGDNRVGRIYINGSEILGENAYKQVGSQLGNILNGENGPVMKQRATHYISGPPDVAGNKTIKYLKYYDNALSFKQVKDLYINYRQSNHLNNLQRACSSLQKSYIQWTLENTITRPTIPDPGKPEYGPDYRVGSSATRDSNEAIKIISTSNNIIHNDSDNDSFFKITIGGLYHITWNAVFELDNRIGKVESDGLNFSEWAGGEPRQAGRPREDYTKSGERWIQIKIWLNNEDNPDTPHETISNSQLQCVEGGWELEGGPSLSNNSGDTAGYASRSDNYISISNSKLCRLQPGRQIQFVVGDSKIDGNIKLRKETIGSICRLSD